MATEVRHGPAPIFSRPISGTFFVTVVGHYTDTPNLAAAGVTEFRLQSERRVKCQAEMLALRTAFKSWAEDTMRALGGSVEDLWGPWLPQAPPKHPRKKKRKAR